MKHYTVKEAAILLSKSEETIRRWLRKGDVFPYAQYNSDKEGWKIPAADIFLYQNQRLMNNLKQITRH